MVTRLMALHLLTRSAEGNPICAERVEHYKEQLRRLGSVDYPRIAFSYYGGEIVDGHHRLTALAEQTEVDMIPMKVRWDV